MNETQIEAMLVSPPDHDELLVHLFEKDGDQFGMIYREDKTYWLEICFSPTEKYKFNVDKFLKDIARYTATLREELNDNVSP